MTKLAAALNDNARLRRALELYQKLDDVVTACDEHEPEMAPESCEKCFVYADEARCAMREALSYGAPPDAAQIRERNEAAGLLALLLFRSTITQVHQTSLTGPGTTYITFTFRDLTPDPQLAANLRSLQAKKKVGPHAEEAAC